VNGCDVKHGVGQKPTNNGYIIVHVPLDTTNSAPLWPGWKRFDVASRNEAERSAVIRVHAEGSEHLEEVIARFRNDIDYDGLSGKDRLRARQSGTTIRKIVRGWDYLDERSQREFLEGALLPSTTLRRIERTRNAAH